MATEEATFNRWLIFPILYIEVDYNRNRRHGANGLISPEAFEAHQIA